MARDYGRHVALRPTDVDVRAGETVAIIGPNGAGKSTLIGILAGAIRPTAGEVAAAPGLRVGWVPQQPGFYARLTPRENLELFARLEGLDARAETDRLLAAVAVPDERKPSADLSGGNQQRLNLAIALLGRPDTLLLDEPTAALDPDRRRALWEVADRVRDRGGAVVFVTQHLEELERAADRVLVLLDGRVVFDGSHEEYERSPGAHVFA
ncbi:MAG TPA: ABC transporter ATP-binding protein [Gaiellaceae bacterium]|nr:ABC transporter ATP-binding protein [Gaiellaceae bacterium]